MAYTTKDQVIENILTEKFSSANFDNFRDDKEVVLWATKKDGSSLEFASEKLKNDRDFLLEVSSKNYKLVLPFASDKLKNDRDFVLAVVRNVGLDLSEASNRFKDDRDVVLAAVKQNGGIFDDLDEKFWDDKEVVMAAIPSNSIALADMSERLRDDPEVILHAVKHHPGSHMFNQFQFASKRLQELCEGKDPVVALMEEIKRVEAEKLGNELSEKDSGISSKKIKI